MRHTRTFIAPDLPEEIAGKAERALLRIGDLEEATDRSLHGTVSYGLRQVDLEVHWAAELEGIVITLQATGDDPAGVDALSAMDRFEASYRNLDDPQFQPDRYGVNPGTLLLAIGLFIVVLLLVTALGFVLLGRVT